LPAALFVCSVLGKAHVVTRNRATRCNIALLEKIQMFQFPHDFDPQPSLANDVLELAPLAHTDIDALAVAASDPAIWAGHPARNRHQRDVFDGYFTALLDVGGTLLVRDRATDAVIGCSAYYTDPSAPSRLSIGYTFLTCAYWGGATNYALKSLMLGHLYQHHSEAWFHIAPQNIRSQTATMNLGAVLAHDADLDLGGGHQPWRCYCLSRESWTHKVSSRGTKT
jgi:N-acetyltransferase